MMRTRTGRARRHETTTTTANTTTLTTVLAHLDSHRKGWQAGVRRDSQGVQTLRDGSGVRPAAAISSSSGPKLPLRVCVAQGTCGAGREGDRQPWRQGIFRRPTTEPPGLEQRHAEKQWSSGAGAQAAMGGDCVLPGVVLGLDSPVRHDVDDKLLRGQRVYARVLDTGWERSASARQASRSAAAGRAHARARRRRLGTCRQACGSTTRPGSEDRAQRSRCSCMAPRCRRRRQRATTRARWAAARRRISSKSTQT